MKRLKIAATALVLLLGLLGFSTVLLKASGKGKFWIDGGIGIAIYGKRYWQLSWTDGESQGTNGISTNMWIWPRFSSGTNTLSFQRYD